MDMTFHPFTCGHWISDKGTMDGASWGERYRSPNPMFAFRHPKGVVLLDTGVSSRGLEDPVGWWGSFVTNIGMEITEEDHVVNQLARVGIAPDEVRYVVMSHLHIDHLGEMSCFPKAIFVVRQSELRFAWWPHQSMRSAYPFNDLTLTRGLDYLELPDSVDFDLFGDGALTCIHTPGHTPGHQSLLVHLPDRENPLLLCQDACYLRFNLEGNPYSTGLMWNVEAWFASLARIRHYERTGCDIWTGHDLDDWEKNLARHQKCAT